MSDPIDRYAEALQTFRDLLDQAMRTDLPEPTAMSLATSDAEGTTSVRVVLLKGVDERGFVFYTNLESRKSRQMQANPRAALGFFWQPLKAQAQVEGRVERVADQDADAYWGTRPRESRIAAWASRQSEPLASRYELLARVRALREEYAGTSIPRPPHWSGYRVVPDRIEFWYAGEFRLHHRVRYLLEGGHWTVAILNP